jgi:hypothetical protein
MSSHHKKHAATAHSGPVVPTTTLKTVVTSGDKHHNVQLVSVEDIRLCAYRKWEIAGKPPGDGIQFWLEAEHELRQWATTAAIAGAGGHHQQEPESHPIPPEAHPVSGPKPDRSRGPQHGAPPHRPLPS